MRNLKKVIALVAVFAMLVSTVAFAATYSDVAEDNNYAEAIEMLSNLGILTGDDADGDGVMDFRPNDTITRAEVAAVVCRIQNINNAAQQNTPFTDVPSSHWASGYVAQAAGQNIINGEGDGIFNPEGNVLYEQAVKMFVRTIGYEPYVEANGGYYTGDLTAATRYGVLDGVVGGTPGADATRGQVAQMAFNAIDTPLMDRYTFGKDAEYVIFDGKGDYDYESLLTRDLGVKKFSGILTENVVTDFAGGKDIDVNDEPVVDFDYDKNDDYDNYDIKDVDDGTVYAGDAADEVYDLIGKHVNVYVKEKDNSKDEFEIISIAASSKNKVVSYNLDQFDAVQDATTLKFFKNENSRTSDPVKVDSDVTIFFNNVAYGASKIENVFGTKGSLVKKDTTWSGKVTLIDNGGTSAYDVIKVEVAATGVVDEVSGRGKVSFKEVPKNVEKESIALDFDETADDQIIKLTKDGQPMDWNELKEWDVLSILYNSKANYYDARVIGSSAIDGSIASRKASNTSSDGYEYTIGGNSYDVAMNAYGIKSGGWDPGTAGLFYVDEYGKIVAYDKNGSTTQSTTSGNYGFIINASETKDDWDKSNVRVQMLDKSGKVAEGYLASKVKLENAGSVGITKEMLGAELKDSATYTVEDFVDAQAIANAMKNQLVTYDANSSGELKTITFWQNADEDDNTLYLDKKADKYSYDEDDKELTVGTQKYDITDDTIIFYIKGDNPISGLGDQKNVASKTSSKVGTVASLAEAENVSCPAAAYDVDNGVPSVVVIFNTSGGISPSSSVAVVDSTGSGYVDGDTVKSITYFLNGEKKTSYLDPDLADSFVDDLTQGSLVNLSLSADGTIINDANVIAITDERTDSVGIAGAATLDVKKANLGTLNKVYFGPVYDYSSANKRIRIMAATTTDEEGNVVVADPASYTTSTKYGVPTFDASAVTLNIKANNANVYVLDPERAKNKLYVGDASDVDYEKDIRDKDTVESGSPVYDEDGNKVDAKTPALGMMDFVVAYEYDGDILDVVIYKAYDFGRYSFEAPKAN